LYAIALGWPDNGQIVVKSLAKTEDVRANRIRRVELLGCKGKLRFTQTDRGLTVVLPEQATRRLTCSLKITGSNLEPVTHQAGNQAHTNN
jgi:alpha-L-fucosidase